MVLCPEMKDSSGACDGRCATDGGITYGETQSRPSTLLAGPVAGTLREVSLEAAEVT